MKALNILVAGTNPEVLRVVVRVINNRESWRGTGIDSVPAAKQSLLAEQFDVLLLSAGLTDVDEGALIDYCAAFHPTVRVIRHYGGGSGLLYNEIMLALGA